MKRKSGILLHISSLPNHHGIGTLGKEAREFIDFLSQTKQTLWQVLPLSPTGYGDSPYASVSAFAGNPLFIDLDILADQLQGKLEIGNYHSENEEKVDFGAVKDFKLPILRKAAEIFLNDKPNDENYANFKNEHKFWLQDYAIFVAIKENNGYIPLASFDEKLRKRDEAALAEAHNKYAHDIEINQVIQYFFYTQWEELKKYANTKEIKIIGDIPLYIAADSADFWTNANQFIVDDNLMPTKVAGVPPDYFSKTGQLWGNPLYNWELMKKDAYKWWIERLNVNFKQFDILRIDHFRGLAEFWAVAAGSPTAEKGEWLKAGAEDFVDAIVNSLPDAEFIAEDLGLITEDVVALRDRHKMPGMKILQFAFGGFRQDPFLPFNFDANCITYTGTHDNDTSKGWFKTAPAYEKEYSSKYINKELNEDNFAHELIRLAFASVAKTVIIQLQDILNLDSYARMNMPGSASGNWTWRYKTDAITQAHKDMIIELSDIYGRNMPEEISQLEIAKQNKEKSSNN